MKYQAGVFFSFESYIYLKYYSSKIIYKQNKSYMAD